MKTFIKVCSIVIPAIFQTVCLATNPEKKEWTITKNKGTIEIHAGLLVRNLNLLDGKISSCTWINGNKLTGNRAEELNFILWKAMPNEEPQGIDYSTLGGIEQSNAVKNQTDALTVKKQKKAILQQVKWIDSISACPESFPGYFNNTTIQITEPLAKSKRLIVTFNSNKTYPGIALDINYEIYYGFPVIRKWIKIRNQGNLWIKISDLIQENLGLEKKYNKSTLLTPNSRGIDPSIVAFSDSAASIGLILASEVPSKVRHLSVDGTVGYNPDFFEWVLGPNEFFESEPVFIYAFNGTSFPTISSVSTGLDRCVESDFQTFLKQKILLQPSDKKCIAPLFCSWTNYSANINDENMRNASEIAARMGFKCFQLDAGWADTGPNGGWAVTMPRPNPKNFNDLQTLSKYINAKKMETGLWYSDFISEKLTEIPDNKPTLFSLPLIKRDGGLGLSLCFEQSRSKYVNDILTLHKTYNANYFKQDLSNVCYGDIARGHESRTLKESYLRGLRGLLATQDEIHRQAPDVWLQLSHEIYWETPGPEADIAVLKHVDSYHSAPNEYWGAGNRSKLVSAEWKYKPDSLIQKLRQGALRARSLWYAHRGLPLERIEVFGAVTTNIKGSLTPQIIDRQICSWLMGAPLSFSGDLNSLTNTCIEQYHNRFTIIEALNQKYNIYSHFQYSGVPAPTDKGWHWWGKLNAEGHGAVIVLRGSSGSNFQKINIPWVNEKQQYKVKRIFGDKDLGIFSGSQLQNGELSIDLDTWGQEILELSQPSGH